MQSFEWRKLHGTTIFHEDTLVKREDAGSFLESGLTIATDQKAPLKRKRCSRSMQKPSESRHPFFEASARSISCWWRPCRKAMSHGNFSDLFSARCLTVLCLWCCSLMSKGTARLGCVSPGRNKDICWGWSEWSLMSLMYTYVICQYMSYVPFSAFLGMLISHGIPSSNLT